MNQDALSHMSKGATSSTAVSEVEKNDKSNESENKDRRGRRRGENKKQKEQDCREKNQRAVPDQENSLPDENPGGSSKDDKDKRKRRANHQSSKSGSSRSKSKHEHSTDVKQSSDGKEESQSKSHQDGGQSNHEEARDRSSRHRHSENKKSHKERRREKHGSPSDRKSGQVLTEHQLVKLFSYSPQSEAERQILESFVAPMGGNRMDNSRTILLGKWVAVKLHDSQIEMSVIFKALTEFIVHFSFYHADGSGSEVYAFQRILTDVVTVKGELVSAVLTALVDQLRAFRQTQHECQAAADGEKAPPPGLVIGKFKFPSKGDARQKCRFILQNSEENVNLVGDDLELVTQILKQHPRAEDKMRYMVGIYIGMHPAAKSRSFVVRREPGTLEDEDFSYVRSLENVSETHDYVYEKICQTILQIITLFPRSTGELVELLTAKFPRLRTEVDEQLTFLKSCLWFARHLTSIRHSMLKIVLQKFLAIDVEMKMADLNYIDVALFEAWKENQLKLLAIEVEKGRVTVEALTQILSQRQWFEEAYRKVRSEEDIDEMANKLGTMKRTMWNVVHDLYYDMLMSYLFVWTDRELSDNLAVKAPLHMVAIAKGLVTDYDDQSGYGSSSAASDSQLSDGAEKVNDGEQLTMSDIVVAEILGIFKSSILPTYQCRCVQFYIFYVVSIKIEWAEKFLQMLFSLLFNPDGDVTVRRMCSSYIASFLCRAVFLPTKFCKTTLTYLLQFLHEFNTLWMKQADERGDIEARVAQKLVTEKLQKKTQLKPDSRLTLFYSVCQAVCYIVCYHGDVLRWTLSRLENPNDDLESPPSGDLSFLINGEWNLISILRSDLAPLVQSRKGIVKGFITTCRRLRGFEALEDRFRQFNDVHSDFDNTGENQALKSTELIDSVFPFDPFQLRQSSRYIRPLYRKWAVVEQQRKTAEMLDMHQPPVILIEENKIENSSEMMLEHDNEDHEKLVVDEEPKAVQIENAQSTSTDDNPRCDSVAVTGRGIFKLLGIEQQEELSTQESTLQSAEKNREAFFEETERIQDVVGTSTLENIIGASPSVESSAVLLEERKVAKLDVGDHHAIVQTESEKASRADEDHAMCDSFDREEVLARKEHEEEDSFFGDLPETQHQSCSNEEEKETGANCASIQQSTRNLSNVENEYEEENEDDDMENSIANNDNNHCDEYGDHEGLANNADNSANMKTIHYQANIEDTVLVTDQLEDIQSEHPALQINETISKTMEVQSREEEKEEEEEEGDYKEMLSLPDRNRGVALADEVEGAESLDQEEPGDIESLFSCDQTNKCGKKSDSATVSSPEPPNIQLNKKTACPTTEQIVIQKSSSTDRTQQTNKSHVDIPREGGTSSLSNPDDVVEEPCEKALGNRTRESLTVVLGVRSNLQTTLEENLEGETPDHCLTKSMVDEPKPSSTVITEEKISDDGSFETQPQVSSPAVSTPQSLAASSFSQLIGDLASAAASTDLSPVKTLEKFSFTPEKISESRKKAAELSDVSPEFEPNQMAAELGSPAQIKSDALHNNIANQNIHATDVLTTEVTQTNDQFEESKNDELISSHESQIKPANLSVVKSSVQRSHNNSNSDLLESSFTMPIKSTILAQSTSPSISPSPQTASISSQPTPSSNSSSKSLQAVGNSINKCLTLEVPSAPANRRSRALSDSNIFSPLQLKRVSKSDEQNTKPTTIIASASSVSSQRALESSSVQTLQFNPKGNEFHRRVLSRTSLIMNAESSSQKIPRQESSCASEKITSISSSLLKGSIDLRIPLAPLPDMGRTSILSVNLVVATQYLTTPTRSTTKHHEGDMRQQREKGLVPGNQLSIMSECSREASSSHNTDDKKKRQTMTLNQRATSELRVSEGFSCSESDFDVYKRSSLSMNSQSHVSNQSTKPPFSKGLFLTRTPPSRASSSFNQLTPILDIDDQHCQTRKSASSFRQKERRSKELQRVLTRRTRTSYPVSEASLCPHISSSQSSSDGEDLDRYCHPHLSDSHDNETRELGFCPCNVSIRQDQMIEEIRDVREWERCCSHQITKPSSTSSLSRLFELVNSRAYQASLSSFNAGDSTTSNLDSEKRRVAVSRQSERLSASRFKTRNEKQDSLESLSRDNRKRRRSQRAVADETHIENMGHSGKKMKQQLQLRDSHSSLSLPSSDLSSAHSLSTDVQVDNSTTGRSLATWSSASPTTLSSATLSRPSSVSPSPRASASFNEATPTRNEQVISTTHSPATAGFSDDPAGDSSAERSWLLEQLDRLDKKRLAKEQEEKGNRGRKRTRKRAQEEELSVTRSDDIAADKDDRDVGNESIKLSSSNTRLRDAEVKSAASTNCRKAKKRQKMDTRKQTEAQQQAELVTCCKIPRETMTMNEEETQEMKRKKNAKKNSNSGSDLTSSTRDDEEKVQKEKKNANNRRRKTTA